MKSYGMSLKMVLVIWCYMKKELLLIETQCCSDEDVQETSQDVIATLPHEYLKMSYKSTGKAMVASLCSNYEGNKKVLEPKATMFVHQYELFRMENEDIETMYSRFQNLVSGIQILKKSYVASDHVNKILNSLPAKWRPKVTDIEEANDLN